MVLPGCVTRETLRALWRSGLLLEGHVLLRKILGSLEQSALGLVPLSCDGLCPSLVLCDVTALSGVTPSRGIPGGSVSSGSPSQRKLADAAPWSHQRATATAAGASSPRAAATPNRDILPESRARAQQHAWFVLELSKRTFSRHGVL